MKKLIAKIMHHIIRFSYPYLNDIELEHRIKADTKLKLRFRSLGKGCFLGEGPLIVNPEHITIGNHFYAKRFLRLETLTEYAGDYYTPTLTIGDNVECGDCIHIGCVQRIEIGNGCSIGSKVLITDHYHGSISSEDLSLRPSERPLSCKPVKIGDNVWLGDNVCIMPGVTLGNNVIVGANAVVTHSFPDNVVIAGVPAQILKHLL